MWTLNGGELAAVIYSDTDLVEASKVARTPRPGGEIPVLSQIRVSSEA